MPFYYNPGVVDHSGELLGRGIEQFGASIGQGIADLGRTRKEAKAADAMYNALQPDDGADGSSPSHPLMPKDKWDSLSWQDKTASMGGWVKAQAIKSYISDQQQQQQQQHLDQQGNVAAANFFKDYQSGSPDPMGTLAEGRGPVATMKTMADPNDRLASGKAAFANLLKYDPQVVARALPKIHSGLLDYAPVMQNQEDNTPVWTKGPNGEDVMSQPRTKNSPTISPYSKAAARVQEIQAQGDVTAGKDLLPEGTEFSTTANGFGIATLPDGTIRNLGKAPTNKTDKKDFFARFMGASAPASEAGGTNDFRVMTDPQGNQVKVPGGRVDEFSKKGYK